MDWRPAWPGITGVSDRGRDPDRISRGNTRASPQPNREPDCGGHNRDLLSCRIAMDRAAARAGTGAGFLPGPLHMLTNQTRGSGNQVGVVLGLATVRQYSHVL